MKKWNTFSRKDFLKNSTLALTGLSMTKGFSQIKYLPTTLPSY
jgi:hypothetical protein